MKTSEQTDQLGLALVAAFAAMKNPVKDSEATVPTKAGGKYSYTYLSLPALLDAVREEFAAHGLAVMQEVTEAGRGIGVTTRLVHTSGQWIESGPLVLPAGGTPQEHGSAITYGRRYALAAIAGISADEDDDASQAQRAATQPPPGGSAGRSRDAGGPQSSPQAIISPGPVTTSTGGAEALGEGAEGSSGGHCPHGAKKRTDCVLCKKAVA